MSHREITTPNGCRYCGIDQLQHCGRWTEGVGRHQWIEPTDAQRLERMRARRAFRGKPPLLDQPPIIASRDTWEVYARNVDAGEGGEFFDYGRYSHADLVDLYGNTQ